MSKVLTKLWCCSKESFLRYCRNRISTTILLWNKSKIPKSNSAFKPILRVRTRLWSSLLDELNLPANFFLLVAAKVQQTDGQSSSLSQLSVGRQSIVARVFGSTGASPKSTRHPPCFRSVASASGGSQSVHQSVRRRSGERAWRRHRSNQKTRAGPGVLQTPTMSRFVALFAIAISVQFPPGRVALQLPNTSGIDGQLTANLGVDHFFSLWLVFNNEAVNMSGKWKILLRKLHLCKIHANGFS